MSDRKPPVAVPPVYKGREQTLVKHILLRDYLERVAWNILSFKDDFVFVDGFSGPWKHASDDYSDTSFGIAIEKLRKVKQGFADRNERRSLRCVFVEKRTAAFQKLSGAAASASDLKAQALSGTFEDHVDDVLRIVGRGFALTFVDPTGWSFDLRKLAPLLKHQPGEVLVNFMYEHFKRFIDDKRPEIIRSQTLPFGDPNWRADYDRLIGDGHSKEEAILEVFKSKLRQVCSFTFVASARVRNRTAGKTHFHLVYGTRHQKGLVEFRRVEKDAMRAQEDCRVQAKESDRIESSGQSGLFSALQLAEELADPDPRADDRQRARQWVVGALGPAPIPYEDCLVEVLQAYSVTEPELKDLLVDLRKEGLVDFDGMKWKQRKPDKGVTIRARAVAA
jgi:three-Cys-motif partner protein